MPNIGTLHSYHQNLEKQTKGKNIKKRFKHSWNITPQLKMCQISSEKSVYIFNSMMTKALKQTDKPWWRFYRNNNRSSNFYIKICKHPRFSYSSFSLEISIFDPKNNKTIVINICMCFLQKNKFNQRWIFIPAIWYSIQNSGNQENKF